MTRRWLLPLLALLVALNGARRAAAADPNVERFELDNGLKVILRPVAGGENVALLTLFDLGDVHDPPAKSGLGHLIEHVYVTAAAGTRPATTAQAWMSRYGGQCNAQTGRDYTLIAAVFPPERLDDELTDAAARMARLEVEQADLDREIPRLKQELANMYGGMPPLAAQNLAGQAADPLPEGARKGGRLDHLATVTVQELLARHQAYYKPANATVVLVGGFDAAAAKKQITDRFGAIASGSPVPDPRPAAPPSPGTVQRVVVPEPEFGEFPDSIATVAYRAPAPDSDLYAPFLVLVANLHQQAMGELRQMTRLRSPIRAVAYMPLDLPNLVFVSATADGREDAEAVARLRRRVAAALPAGDAPPDALPDAPPDLTFLVQSFGSMLGLTALPERIIGANPYFLAFSLGRRDQLGIDAAALQARLEALTSDQLRRCAREVFGDDRGAAVVVRVQ